MSTPFKTRSVGGAIKVVQVISKGPKGDTGAPGAPGNAPVYPVSYPLNGQRVLTLDANDELIYADCRNASHALTIIGLIKEPATTTASPVDNGNIKVTGWGLTPGSYYYLGQNGVIQGTIDPLAVFVKIVGIALDADTLQITRSDSIIL